MIRRLRRNTLLPTLASRSIAVEVRRASVSLALLPRVPMTRLWNGRARQWLKRLGDAGLLLGCVLCRLCAPVRRHAAARVLAHLRLQRSARGADQADSAALLRDVPLLLALHQRARVRIARQGPLAGVAVHHRRLRDCGGVRHLPAIDHPVRLVHQPAGAGRIPGAAASAAGRPRAHSCRWARARRRGRSGRRFCCTAPAISAPRWPSRSRRGTRARRTCSASSTTIRHWRT